MVSSPPNSGWRGGPPRDIDYTRVQRPEFKRNPQPNVPAYNHAPLILRPALLEWQKRPDLTVRIRGVHASTTTYELYENFKNHGEIVLIEIFQDETGVRDGGAKIRFSPPPTRVFWDKEHYELTVDNRKKRYLVRIKVEEPRYKNFQVQSPIKKTKFYDPKMKLFVTALHFGFMMDPTSVMPMHTARRMGTPGKQDDVSLTVDLNRRKIEVTFKVKFTDPRSEGSADYISESPIGQYHRINKFKFWVPFDQLQEIRRINLENGGFALVISLDSPPQFFRKREDEKSCHTNDNCVWSEFDTWFRQTDIVYDPYRLQNAIVTLHKERPVIDIGRWTTYVLVFEKNQEAHGGPYGQMKEALADFNIDIVEINQLDNVPPSPTELWSLIDPQQSEDTVVGLQTLDVAQGPISLPFAVRYQLEVCISQKILNEHNIQRNFITRLAEIASPDSTKAKNILEYVAAQDKRIFDPMTIFEDEDALAYCPKSEIPHYCAYARKANITPSTIYFNTPTVETTNRVLRHYARENNEGRFLRVQFTDEIAEGRINACADKQRNDELFTRVYRTLFNGIRIGDRHYEFLAFGNSQFRENGAYFFCPTEYLSCDDIRQWMGNFSHIKVVAKYAARLGQCFSTTRAINGLSKPDIVKIPDIEYGSYNFTDGVGKISPFLAQMITVELGLRANTAPSVFQFRLGGCKGVLAVWQDAKDREVHIRPSQQKFAATYNGLEIIRWSRFSACTLNRQTITILSSLGVPDEVFLHMLEDQLRSYHTAMHDNDVAVSLLSRYVDDNQMTVNIASMINNGFMAERDPFVLSLLHLWRSWSIKLLKEKAKIIVENGAFLLGCVDETKTLRGYKQPTGAVGEAPDEDELPQIFLQVPSRDDENKYVIIEAVCLVGRNPSLHPGDLRVVQAVNVPALHHLRDVVVFPQKGERDVPGMCSGGDLDGDDFFVIWDKALQPIETNCTPMNYDAPTPKEQSGVKVTDLMKFFVRFMKNDALPTIAHAHLGQSDAIFCGIKDPKCLELAALHSKAVDYVKTGQPAEMPKRLKPFKWPHFMEKRHQPSYHSKKILGQLYDKVDSVDFVPKWMEPFDKRILRAYPLDDGTLKAARQVKTEYDIAMRRIMAQQEINTEFEVWSTFVLSKPRVGSDYKVQENMTILSDGLKEQFRAACIEKAGIPEGSKDFSKLGPFVAAMYKVTKEELDIALAETRMFRMVGGRKQQKRKLEQKYMPLISFPWLFEKELGRIATGMDAEDDMVGGDLVSWAPKKDGQACKRHGAGGAEAEDYITRDDGVLVHRGDELDLFGPEVDSDELSDESGFEEARGSYVVAENGELVLNTGFQVKSTPAHLLSGTGVEDVVPRTELDGFVNPREIAQPAHNTAHVRLTTTNLAQLGCVPTGGPITGTLALFPSNANPSLLDSPILDKLGPDAEEELFEASEEEEITLDLQESSLSKLARLHAEEEQFEEPEEEEITLDMEESSLEKLARMHLMDS